MKKKILSILITIFAISMCLFTLTACGENEPPHTHNYNEFKKSATQHWYECECGEKNEIEGHKGGTATCKEKAACVDCGTLYGSIAEHCPKQEWIITATHHYQECVYNCAEKLNYREHNWDEGVITKTPTAGEKGEKTYTCITCEKTKKEDVLINGYTITVSSKTVNKGENVEIIVSIHNNPGIWSAILEIEIDTDMFEFVSYDTTSSIFADFGECGYDLKDNKFKFNGRHSSVESNVTKDGIIFKIILKAKSKVVEKSSTLVLDILEVINVDMQDIIFNKIDGDIIVNE